MKVAWRTPSPEEQAIDARASVLMKRGIGLLHAAPPGDIAAALSCFDEALELRRALPVDEVPMLRYGLAAVWLNRGEALMRMSDASALDLARGSFDEAIALMRTLPLDQDPRFLRRLAIAHNNRGLVIEAQHAANTTDAIEAFGSALSALDHLQAALIQDRASLAATIWTNLARLHARVSTLDADVLARDAAYRALGIVANTEREDVAAAETGLTARYVLCQTLARRLAQAAESDARAEDVHEATDVVDQGLRVARYWERQSVGRLRQLGVALFRFGAMVYGGYQPQFLIEFVEENVDPARSSADFAGHAELQSVAREALARMR
jgi:tetratricopeptide (TPR) repeat protein